MRYWVVDSETTGVTSSDKAVEVAGFLCEDGEIVDHYQTLVNPGIPIPPEASAIHHITDKDVEGAPPIEDAIVPFLDTDFDFVVAHNAIFDKRYIDLGQAPWACTYKLAMVVYPDAPSHSNQFLRYFLKLPELRFAAASFAHRALYDAEVSTYLFQHLLSKATSEDPLEKMLKVSNEPVLLKTCKFGKHKGQAWKDVPKNYLDYILNKSSGWDDNVLYTARFYYER